MIKFIKVTAMTGFMSYMLICLASVSAEEPSVAQPPPEIVVDAPPPTQSPVKQESIESETVTIYDSNVLPGFRPCTTQDYRDANGDVVACEDAEEARVISTRDKNESEDLIVEDDAVPQGNIFKLKFERFKKKKTQ